MVFKGFIAAATAVALSATPAVAAANGAARASAAVTQVAPAEEAVDGSELRGRGLGRGGFIIPLLAIIAIILGILAATGELGGDDDRRTSP